MGPALTTISYVVTFAGGGSGVKWLLPYFVTTKAERVAHAELSTAEKERRRKILQAALDAFEDTHTQMRNVDLIRNEENEVFATASLRTLLNRVKAVYHLVPPTGGDVQVSEQCSDAVDYALGFISHEGEQSEESRDLYSRYNIAANTSQSLINAELAKL